MNIQYIGFSVVAASRVYSFRASRAPEDIREFTVDVRSDAFRSTLLKFQDGPDICFARLRRELDRETHEERAESQLHVEEQDIQEYLQRHYPRKRS
jgi:hypothetical protein